MPWAGRRSIFGNLFSLVWLIFLIFPLSNLLDGRHRFGEVAVSLLSVASFCLVYAWFWLRAREGRPASLRVGLLSLALLASVMTLVSGDWSSLFIYVSATAGRVFVSWRRAVLAVAAVTVLCGALALVELTPPLYLFFILVEVPLIGLAVSGSSYMVRANRALTEARHDVAQLAVAEERLRFARDLHDLLGHSLSVIVLKAELARRLAEGSPERAAAEVADIERVARQALTEVREAVAGYRVASLSDELQQARVALAAAGVRVRIEEPDLLLSAPVASVLAWALREGVTNVVRHAGASAASICLNRTADRAQLELTDDGTGSPAFQPGNGLSGVRERVAGRHGELQFGPRPEGGWRLLVTVPL